CPTRVVYIFYIQWAGRHRDLHSFPTRRSSDLAPVLQAFDIKALNNGASVVEVTDFFSKDVQALGLNKRQRETYKVKRLDDKRSLDRKSTRLNSSHVKISYAVFCLKKKKKRCYK